MRVYSLDMLKCLFLNTEELSRYHYRKLRGNEKEVHSRKEFSFIIMNLKNKKLTYTGMSYFLAMPI